jgi:hypothetical protein
MKVFAFLVALAFFVGSFVLFGYSFAVGPGWDYAFFGGGLLAVAISLAIPFHLLEKFD